MHKIVIYKCYISLELHLMYNWDNFIQTRLAQIALPRQTRSKIQNDPRLLIEKDSTHLNFISNDYLGLSNNLQIKNALIESASQYGIGSTGAPTLSGYSAEHGNLAQALATWLGYAKCMLFNSGYQLNLGIFAQLCDDNTTIWLDKNCHASHIDGILLSKCKFHTFTPRTLDDTLQQIRGQPTRRHIVLSEGTFSMDGTSTYLNKLIQLRIESAHNTLLIIDDAHGVAALGESGLGTLEQLGFKHQFVDLFIGTLGKAFASHGGFVCGSSQLIDYLQQSVRSWLFSTCLPPCIAKASLTSLEIITSSIGVGLRQNLKQNIKYFQELSTEYGLNLHHVNTNISPIQLLVFTDEDNVKNLFDQLYQSGVLVGRMLYPTVAKSAPRIRISLTASHTKQDIQLLCKLIHQYGYANA